MIKLSLGCGIKKEEDFIGFDNEDYGWNLVWEAGDPLPYADNYVDFIKAENFIEHLPRLIAIKVFNECWRILKPSGIFIWTAPDAKKSIELALADPTHQSLWVRGCAQYLSGERPRNADYGIKPWTINIKDHEKDERIMIFEMKPRK